MLGNPMEIKEQMIERLKNEIKRLKKREETYNCRFRNV